MTAPTPIPVAGVPALTDRYVQAALHRAPHDERPDLERELRASVADAVDDRIAAGEPADAAERAVLTGLGDPAVLSARYRSRPLHLIGPTFYPEWARLVRILLISVLPVVAVVSFAINSLAAGSVGAGFGALFGTVLNVGIHLVFWPTLLFFVLERRGETRWMSAWTVDRLPDPGRGARLTEMLSSIAFAVLIAGAIVWQQLVGFVRVDGVVVPLLPEASWALWIPLYLVGLALSVILAVARFRAGRITAVILAGLLVAVALNFLPGILLALQGRLVEPRFFTALGLEISGPAWDTINLITVLVLALVLLWSLADAVLQHRRDRRSEPKPT
jgi:hypothetical protein